ncbi:MAG: hypothetical protein V4543_06455 [Bacteroidota bacterium]
MAVEKSNKFVHPGILALIVCLAPALAYTYFMRDHSERMGNAVYFIISIYAIIAVFLLGKAAGFWSKKKHDLTAPPKPIEAIEIEWTEEERKKKEKGW